MTTLAERGALGHHGSDDYATCVTSDHWDRVPPDAVIPASIKVHESGVTVQLPKRTVGQNEELLAATRRTLDALIDQSSVMIVETNGSEPEVTTVLRGAEPEVIHVDWDEVERGDNPAYITDILDQIEELGVGDLRPERHVGMPEVVAQLRATLAERFPDAD